MQNRSTARAEIRRRASLAREELMDWTLLMQEVSQAGDVERLKRVVRRT